MPDVYSRNCNIVFDGIDSTEVHDFLYNIDLRPRPGSSIGARFRFRDVVDLGDKTVAMLCRCCSQTAHSEMPLGRRNDMTWRPSRLLYSDLSRTKINS